MSQKADTFTRWGIVAAGEGGGRIASRFLLRAENPGIENRIMLMNTNRADLRNTLDRMRGELVSSGGVVESEDIEQYGLEFGSERGAGNFFPDGRACAEEDLDAILNEINGRMLGTDAILYVATLGGGTGNGSVPYVIDQVKRSDRSSVRDWMRDAKHVALAAWPYANDRTQQHFNAVCGLSRFLMNERSEQNADMLLLVANSHLANNDNDNTELDRKQQVNKRIVPAIDLLIGAGRETDGVIDVKDYVRTPSLINAYHFTPAVTINKDVGIIDLEYIFEQAADNAFVPLDVNTARAVFAVVRGPEDLRRQNIISESSVQRAFDSWLEQHGISDAVGESTFIPTRERGSDVDVLLLVGGFDLGPLLNYSLEQFRSHRQSLHAAGGPRKSELSQDRLDAIWRRLQDYREYSQGDNLDNE